jgi:hypothetical protein
MDNRTLAMLGHYADGQYGQVTAEQASAAGADLAELEAAGFAEPVIDGVWRLCAGGHHSHPRLYATWLSLAPTVPGWQRDLPATGVVSHSSALRLYRAGDEAGSQPEFTVPHPLVDTSTRVHVAGLVAQDWQTLAGLPVTAPARTLVDVAGRLDTDELARVIDTLIVSGQVTAARLRQDVAAQLDRLPRLGVEQRQLAQLVAQLVAQLAD